MRNWAILLAISRSWPISPLAAISSCAELSEVVETYQEYKKSQQRN